TGVAVGRGAAGVRHSLGVRHLEHPGWCGCGAGHGWCRTPFGCQTPGVAGLMWLWGVARVVSDTFWVADAWSRRSGVAGGRGTVGVRHPLGVRHLKYLD